MIELPSDLQVNQPTVTLIGNKFICIENYISILEYDKTIIRVKTKSNVIKILGDKLSLKYITDAELGIKGIIHGVEYSN